PAERKAGPWAVTTAEERPGWRASQSRPGSPIATAAVAYASARARSGATTVTEHRPVDTIAPPATAPPAEPPTVSPTASAGGVPVSPRPDRVLTSTGGTVVARCVDGGAYLVSWSPAQGYRAEEVRRGRAAVARVSFAASRKIV